MGVLDSSTLTVNATLTTRGRELLSTNGTVDITKFALSDEEIDYTLHDRKHASGTNSFGIILDNAIILEASPTRSKLNSYLKTDPHPSTDIILERLNYPRLHWNAEVGIIPETLGRTEEKEEDYTFTIENTSVVRFNRYYIHKDDPWLSSGDLRSGKITTWTARAVTIRAKIINPGATTTVTVKGNVSGITKVVSMTTVPNPDAKVYAKPSTKDVTHPKFY